MQKTILIPPEAPAILGSAAVVGKREHEGPLGDLFDFHDDTDRFGMETWEQSEAAMQHTALNLALAKAKMKPDELDALLAGDLINQCVSSTFGLLAFDVPQIGLYGACSTIAEGLGLAALLVGAGTLRRAAAVTSSHNCSAERQFRFPLEYGGQRTPTSQWTVTGSAAFLIGKSKTGPYLSDVMFGRSVDPGITDANNMGAAMAPAAADTLLKHFADTGRSPDDYDCIVTGDLGEVGSHILYELLSHSKVTLNEKKHMDCGRIIFDTSQDVHAGGSGCGCIASVLGAALLPKLASGAWRRAAVMATGALLSPTTSQQGESIPGVAHLIVLEGKETC